MNSPTPAARSATINSSVQEKPTQPPTTMKEILADLVAFPTVSANHEANQKALDYIHDFLKKRGMYVTRHEINGYGSLVATTRPTKKPQVLLAGHIDVVAAPDESFELIERDGKFYGRGTCDMKFALAVFLQFVDDIKDNLSDYDFGLMITSDEEEGGRNGVYELLKLGYRAKAVVLPDGGDDWALEQAAKGLLWIIARASGVTAHGSRPWEGENAIEKMSLFLSSVKTELFATQGENTSTCNIGTVQGGNTVNQIPDICTANIDIRPVNKQSQERIIKQINQLSNKYDIDLEYRLNDPPINVNLANPYVLAFTRSIEKITKAPLKTMRSNGGSDARYFVDYDIPTLVIYPSGGGRHGDGEWIGVDDFYKFYDLIRNYMDKTAKNRP